MSFDTTLRRRASCSSLVPVLVSSPGLNLRGTYHRLADSAQSFHLHTAESSHPTHDLAIPLHNQRHPTQRTLRLLVFTPTTLNPTTHSATLSRIQHFAVLTGGRDIAILFLLTPSPSQPTSNPTHPTPLHAYCALQLALSTVSTSGVSHIPPLLPCPSPSSVPTLLKTFTDTLASAPAQTRAVERKRQVNAALDLLPHCTVEAILGEEAGLALMDLSADLRGVVSAALAGDAVARGVDGGVVEFWREEWVA